MAKFHVHTLTQRTYGHTVLWALTLSILIVVAISALARATHNFNAALTEKPDVAVYMLLPDLHIQDTKVLREEDDARDYLANTPTGPMLIKLKKGPEQWYVEMTESLHEDAVTASGSVAQPE